MSWKRITEQGVEAPEETTQEEAPLHPDLEVALRHYRNFLLADLTHAISRRRADESSALIPAEHIGTFLDLTRSMDENHAIVLRDVAKAKGLNDSFKEKWKQIVRYPRRVKRPKNQAQQQSLFSL